MLKVKEKKLQTELIALENQGLQGEHLHEINNNKNSNNNNNNNNNNIINIYNLSL